MPPCLAGAVSLQDRTLPNISSNFGELTARQCVQANAMEERHLLVPLSLLPAVCSSAPLLRLFSLPPQLCVLLHRVSQRVTEHLQAHSAFIQPISSLSS